MHRDGGKLLQQRDLFGKLIAIDSGLGQDIADFDEVLGTVGNGLHQTFDFGDRIAVPLLQAVALAAKLPGLLGEFGAIFLDVDFDQVLVEHVMLQSVKDAGLEAVGRDDALRKAAERTIHGLWNAIGRILDLYSPQECANYLANAGYDAD